MNCRREPTRGGILPPLERISMYELLIKQTEIIESLVKLNKITLNLLSQHIDVREYEYKMSRILNGDDIELD